MAKKEKQETAEKQILTNEDLTAAFPELVEQVVAGAKKEAAAEIAALDVGMFKKKFVTLYGKIVESASAGTVDAAAMKIPGFLLDVDDPFAMGAARVFAKLRGTGTFRLPVVLPYKNPNSKAALESYILRADGGGDAERADRAREALKKIKG